MNDLPEPPKLLPGARIELIFQRVLPGDVSRGFVPAYHYDICRIDDGERVGYINLRVGETEHVRLCAGHVGYEVDLSWRGYSYAARACEALKPWMKQLMDEALVTCDPRNVASLKTIEKIGATWVDDVDVPEDDPHYARGTRVMRRFSWK